MSLSAAILVGVLSSFVASVMFLISVRIIDRALIPWFRQQVYRGIDISGRWEYKNVLDGTDYQLHYMEIRQAAERVSGTYTLVSSIENSKDVSTYELCGIVADSYLTGYTFPKNKDELTRSSFFFRITENVTGMMLVGKICSLDFETREVEAMSIEFTKIHR
jgi:hypothetical protein